MRRIPFVLAASLALGSAGSARAQAKESPPYLSQRELAPRKAFELTLGTGYSQGFGQLRKGSPNNINDVANGGMGFHLAVGYRISPRFGIAATACYAELGVGHAAEGATGARGFVAAADVTYHLAPYHRLAPWMRAGAGYRLLWRTSNTQVALDHGFDFLRLATGLDLRASSDVSLGPILGADLDVFLWERVSGAKTHAIADPRVSVFVYLGLQGRFDIGGSFVSESSAPP